MPALSHYNAIEGERLRFRAHPKPILSYPEASARKRCWDSYQPQMDALIRALPSVGKLPNKVWYSMKKQLTSMRFVEPSIVRAANFDVTEFGLSLDEVMPLTTG